jgi:hypothetical protein
MTRFLSALALLLFTAAPAAAQVGIGGLIGDPTGLTLKAGAGRGAIVLDVNLDDAIYGQLHYLIREQRLSGTGSDIRFSFGPGVILGESGNDTAVGLSALFGLGWYIDPRFELFGQVTPRLILTPDTDGDVGVAAGLRFYP